MTERNKKGNYRLSDFLRYKENKMTDRERNSFERNLHKDAFSREAIEGLENIDPLLAGDDIAGLRKQLKKRTSRKQRVFWYRIAASLAVLMFISSILIFTGRRKTPEQLSYNPVTRESGDLQILKDQPQTEVKAPSSVPVEKEKAGSTVRERIIPPPAIPNVAEVAEVAAPDQVFAAEKVIPGKLVMAKKSSVALAKISGRIISSEDNLPIPGANVTVKGTSIGTVTDLSGTFSLNAKEAANRVLVANFVGMESKEFKAVEDSSLEIKLEPTEMALSEVVVVGYGVKDSGKEDGEDVNEFNPSHPVNGRADFDKYIRENIRRPDPATAGQRVVVVLNFKVDTEGKIDSITIIRSPGKNFSDEAIRLIKEGPEWKPAEENGKTINDEVRIRIVFK